MLHQAVIHEDTTAIVQALAEHPEWLKAQEQWGFTPLELSHFLKKQSCIPFLDDRPPPTIRVLPKGETAIRTMSLEEFEAYFGISYLQYPFFPSYKQFCEVVKQCPYILRSTWLVKENYAWTERYRQQLDEGSTAPLYIRWISDVLGYGAFADADIPEGTFLGEYTGVIRQLQRRHPDQNEYCLHYPTKWWSKKYFVTDSQRGGNITRFINHSYAGNAQPLCLVDRHLLRQVFVANQHIPKDKQITFNYGNDFWKKRKTAEGS